MLDAGTIETKLRGDFDPKGHMLFDGANRRSEKSMTACERAIAASTARSSRALKQLGTVAGVGTAGAFAALGIGVYKSVKAYADYNKEMQTVQAVSKASKSEMAALEVATKKIGTTTKFSATQAAQGSVELVKAGMSVKQVIGGGLKTALSLAAAGDLELADAAQYTANSMDLFGIQAKNASQIADGLATAANDTTADVSDFGMALTQGGSAAKMAGLGFQDTMVILEALAKVGIKNSDAGTSMKTALLQLISPTKKQAELQEKLGLSFVGANGKMKDGVQISKELHKATKGRSDAERTAIFKTLAGTDGIRTLNALYAAGPALLHNYELGLTKSGTAAETAAARQKGLSGSLDRAKASFNTALVVIGQKLAPTIENFANKFQSSIGSMLADGRLAHFGDQMASGLTMAVHAGQGLIAVLRGMIAAGAPAAAIIKVIAQALAMIPPEAAGGALMGVVAALTGMRVAAAIAPMLSAVATGIGLVRTAIATGELAALPGLLMAAANPLGMLVAGAAVAGAGIALLATHESNLEQAADAAAASIRAQTAALNSLKAAEDAAAGKTIDRDQADISYKQALANRRAIAKEEGKGSLAYAQATLDVRRAAQTRKQAHDEEAKSVQKLYDSQLKTRNEAGKGLAAARQELAEAQRAAMPHVTGSGKGGARVSNPDPAAIARVEVAQQKLNAQLARSSVEYARASISTINYKRQAQGLSPITDKNVAGISQLVRVTQGMPKEKITKLMLSGDQAALSKLGRLALKLDGIVPTKRLTAILTGDGSVKQKLAALAAEARKHERKVIRAILTGDGTAQQKLNALKALKIPNKQFEVRAVQVGPFSFDVVVNKRTKSSGNAIGAAAGRAKTDKDGMALIGEGSNPREAVVSGKTGEGYFTTGPMFDRLGPDDYVIPTDNRHRGRATGLFVQLANDLGIPGFKKGKKGKGPKVSKDFPVPPKYQKVALSQSLDQMQADRDNAKSRYESIKSKPKGKRKGLDSAKKKFQKLDREWKQAKKFSDAIAKLEDQVELAEGDMSIGSKNGDGKLWGKGKDARKKALDKLTKWLGDAVKLAPNSPWGRELKKKLNDKTLQAMEEGPTAKDTGEYLTEAEQARLDALDAQAAEAELTTNTIEDDKAALGSIASLREQIYNRVKGAGAPSTVIADAARALKSARDAANGVTQTEDSQAIIDQANERARVARKESDANAAAVAALYGSGDIGTGGRNAWEAAGGPSITINTLHPGDPQTVSALAGAVAAGIPAQGYVPTSRVKTGL